MRVRLLLALLVLVLSSAVARAAEVILAWDCPEDCARATGFTLYQLQSSNCTTLAQFSPTSLPIAGSARQVLVTGLQPGQTYCWYLTAVNAVGESGPSNTLVWSVPLPPQKPGAPVNLRQGKAALTAPAPQASTESPAALLPPGMPTGSVEPAPLWMGNNLQIYRRPRRP